MIFRSIVALLLFLYSGVSFAQLGGSPEKSAFKNIAKHRWQKAESKLRKALAKDTLSPSVRYGLAIFYFDPSNPSFDLDSAYHYTLTALNDYHTGGSRKREHLKRLGADSSRLITLREKIDSTAFELARSTNTEAAYLEFLSHFPSAVQRDLAARLRDEVAFQDALKENTYDAFYRYTQRYPGAERAAEARTHYHRLLYMEETKDKRLTSYESFLIAHPETPYRLEVNRNIFHITTADGTVDSFLSFISRYPENPFVNRSRQIVFHLLASEHAPVWPPDFLTDSLRNLLQVNDTYLVPFLKNDRYGFMDEFGMEVLKPRYESIHADYLCGHITDEILIVDHHLIARNGSTIYDEKVEAFTDLGFGFLKVEVGDGSRIIHKAGFLVADTIDEARIVGKAFLALKKESQWFIYSFGGKLLDPRSWDDITAFKDIVVFSRGSKKFLTQKSELGKTADANPLLLSEAFDEVKLWPGDLVWGRSGEFQGVLNQSLKGVIRFDKQTLSQTSFGAVGTLSNRFVLYNWSGSRSPTFDDIRVLGNRLGVKEKRSWFVFEPSAQKRESKAYDSLRAEGPFIVGIRNDSAYVHFGNRPIRAFFRPQKIAFVPGMDSTSFLVVQETGTDKTVFDLSGRKLFSSVFDALEYAGKGIFVVTRKDKKGLLSMRGETVLPADFDALGSARNNVVSILKNKKFGAFHLEQKKLIKAQYDRNLVPYAGNWLITFKNGFHGFVGWDNKPLGDFEFDEITYWNDSLALVKKGTQWNLFDLTTGGTAETNLRSINLIKDTPEEKLAIIQKDNNFGVISNRGKILIPPTFSDIINLGSAEAPLYFTEKHVPEASLYIVIYYDRTGEMLRKEIYDDAADYDKIYCSDQ